MPRIFVVALFLAMEAAAVQQPNGTVVPSPLGCNGGQPFGLGALFACQCTAAGVCNIGAPCTVLPCDTGLYGTCETTLWHAFNDNTCIPSNLSGLDPVADASVVPSTFLPCGPVTFRLTGRGLSPFGNAFGWYNATGSAPNLADMHIIFACAANAGASVTLDFAHEPAYLGGRIGFFLVTPESHASPRACAGGDCCASVTRLGAGDGWRYTSEPAFDSDWNGAASYVHLLVYASRLSESRYYFAWEDVYGGFDNEFLDLVASADGLVVADTTAPVVTPPPALALDQTLCCGVFGGASPASSAPLADFLSAGSATDGCTSAPAHLAPQVNGADVTDSTCFPGGTTSVTFRFQDLAANVGSAGASLTVRMFGDLNVDGAVDPSDMVVLRAYFNFAISPGVPPFGSPLGMADLNHDLVVDPTDMVLLRAFFNFVVGCFA